ncbi:putative organic cation/carnitine transporter 7-like [Capsicum annuum]|nr:putative organic cation/carnitine transporter 7-like [Capsicum annuum]
MAQEQEEEDSSVYTLEEAFTTVRFGKFQYMMMCYAGVGFIVEAAETMILSFIGPSLRKGLLSIAIVTAVAAALSTFSQNYNWLLAGHVDDYLYRTLDSWNNTEASLALIYPTSVRSTGIGVASSVVRIGAMFSPIVVVQLVRGCQQMAAIISFEAVLGISAASVLFISLETKGRELIDCLLSKCLDLFHFTCIEVSSPHWRGKEMKLGWYHFQYGRGIIVKTLWGTRKSPKCGLMKSLASYGRHVLIGYSLVSTRGFVGLLWIRSLIHLLTLLVAFQTERVASITPSFEATRVGQFITMSPPTFTGSKFKENPQYFIDEMEKIFCVIHSTNMKGVEFADYQLKDMSFQWFCGQLHHGFCNEGRYRCFKCGHPGHMLRNFPIGNVASGQTRFMLPLHKLLYQRVPLLAPKLVGTVSMLSLPVKSLRHLQMLLLAMGSSPPAERAQCVYPRDMVGKPWDD